MGAWSHDPFGNDDAADWLYDLKSSPDLSVIEIALNAVTDDAADYLEAPECTSALAAAEIVAALLGKPIPSLPKEAVDWVKGKPKPDAALVEKARRAVTTVLESSELQELWAEAEDDTEWQAVTKNLLIRLG